MSTDRDLDLVCRALGDPTRRKIVRKLIREPGLTSGELARGSRQISRWAVLKHLAVLREAGLVATLADGRLRRHYVDAAPLASLNDWLRETESLTAPT